MSVNAIQRIDTRLAELSPDTVRYKVLMCFYETSALHAGTGKIPYRCGLRRGL